MEKEEEVMGKEQQTHRLTDRCERTEEVRRVKKGEAAALLKAAVCEMSLIKEINWQCKLNK